MFYTLVNLDRPRILTHDDVTHAKLRKPFWYLTTHQYPARIACL